MAECNQKMKSCFTLHDNVKGWVFFLFRPMAEIYFVIVKARLFTVLSNSWADILKCMS